MGLVRVVASEFVATNGFDQFTGLSRCLGCTLQAVAAGFRKLLEDTRPRQILEQDRCRMVLPG